MVTVPTTIFPVSERFIACNRELIPATPQSSAGPTIPMTSFQPEDKPVWLTDEAWRASMAGEYDLLQGPIWTETSMAGPVYGDTLGHLLFNILGDLTSTGTATTPNTTLTSAPAVGATTLAVVSGTSFTVGMKIQIDTGTNAEIVTVLSGASTSITLNASTPVRLVHGNTVAVTNTTNATTTYTNIFSLLNGGNGQPPSHTFTDRTQIPGSGNNLAVQYAFGCLSQLVLTGNAQNFFAYTANMTSYYHAYPSAPVTASISAVRAMPTWHSIVSLAGTQVNDITEWQITLTRVVEPIPTADGSQNPFVIARGKFTATANLTFNPALDETSLLYMLNNTQPTLGIVFSNGLTAQNNITYTISAQVDAFDTAKINEGSALFGYDTTAKLIANTTNVGNSGGYSPIQIQLQNASPGY
jgi:hypothetical protein